MFNKFLEWLASKSNPRFRAYRSAQLLFENFLNAHPEGEVGVTDESRKQAQHDVTLKIAAEQFKLALKLSEGEETFEDAATARYELGRLCYLLGRLEEAQEYLRSALSIFAALPYVENSTKSTMSSCHYYLGTVAIETDNLTYAVSQTKEALEIERSMGNARGERRCLKRLELCKRLEERESQ
jgi:tetratricopeptide (TPR) repeat protein